MEPLMNGIPMNSCEFSIWSSISCSSHCRNFLLSLILNWKNIWIWFWTLKNPKFIKIVKFGSGENIFAAVKILKRLFRFQTSFLELLIQNVKSRLWFFDEWQKNSRIKSSTLRTREKLVKTLKIQNFSKLWNSRNK